MEDISLDAGVSVTNTVQENENKRKTSTTPIYLKPTTMRGVPLASLIPSPVIRGFYITRNENDLPSSTDSSTPPYTTTVEQQTETTLISAISTTDETVTVIQNDRIESGPNALDDNVNDIVDDKGVDGREEKYSSPSVISRDSDNAENRSNYEKPDLITIPIDRPASKREESLRSFDHTTPLSNSYVVSSTTPTRRRIALAVSRYKEATTPLWTGRRVVAKRRNRTTVSPIRDAIRRTESDSVRTVTTALINASLTTAESASTLTSRRRKRPTTPTTPILSIVPDSTASPEVLNVHNNLANSNDTETEEPESHATVEAAVTLTNLVIAATPSVSKITLPTNDPTIDISTFSDEPTTMMVSAVADTTITTTASTIAVVKAPAAATTDAAAITTTSAITNIGVETTSSNYSVTDNPTIENTNVSLTDSAAAIAFAASTESEITKSTSLNIETAQTIATDPVTKSTAASTEIEATSTMTSHSTIIPDTVNAQEITIIDSANDTTIAEINADIGATSTIANYSTIPTTISTHDVMTDATSTTTASTEVETTSTIGNYSTFTTTAIKNTTTIPVTTILPLTTTTSPLITVISSTMNTQHIQATAPMTTNNLADANTVTANMITTTTPLSVINPTITDFNVSMTSANANIPSTSATSETSSTMIQSKTSSVTSSKTPITSTIVTSTSAAPTTLTTESSTIHLADPNNLDINNSFETVIATAASTQTTEIPTTFETPSVFTSTAIAFTKPLHSTNFEASSVVTAALSSQEDKSFFTPKVTQTPSTLLSIASITNKVITTLEKSTTSATHSSIFGESITTNPTIRTTNADDADSVRTISEESTMPERKTEFKEATSTESRTEDQIITTINKPSSARTMSEESTTPEIKITFEKATSETMENQKQNQTTSELDTTNYQFSRKTARRRVLNRTNNWLGSPVTLQRTNQSPRHWVTSYRGSRRPPTYISSSKMAEKNSRRRITQKRLRVNSEAFNNTVRPDRDAVDVQNTTEDVMYDRVGNVRKMKVILENTKEKAEEETITILPKKETTVFLQSSFAIKNETLQVHHDNGNIEERRNILKKVKQSEENFTTKEIGTNSTNDNLPDDSQSNLHATEDLSELEKSRKMKAVLKDVRPQSEGKNPVEEVNADSDSMNTNLQNNFSKSPYADKNLSDKRITGRRMRVVLKSVRPKSREKNVTVEETNMETDSTDKNLQNNLLNSVNVSQNFSNEKKTRRMRVVLKRVKSKSEEEGTKTEDTNTEYDSTNESLQGTFSNNFYSAKNFPVEHETRRRMRVVLKSVKPKSEEKNSTVEETTVDPDSTNKNLQGTFSNNFHSDKSIPVEYGTRRRMRVALKSVKLKSERENSTLEETDSDSTSKNFQSTFLNNSRRGKDFPVENGTKRRIRVILKSVKSKSEERNSTIEETNEDSDSIDKDLQGSFSSNRHAKENLSNDKRARKRTEVVLKSVKSISKERDSVAEETSADSDFARKDPQVLYTFHFSSNLHLGDNLPDEEKKHSKSEEKEAMTERPEPQTTRTSIPVEEDTDRPSLEVTNGGSVSRNAGSGYSNRHRKPTPFTTIAPLTSTLSNTLTVHRRGRPAATTLSSRIDFIDAFEDTESYVKPAAVLHDQNADVSDQSIRAQEFAVTLSDPPSSSSSGTGRTSLKDVDRRKISTTIAPRTDPTISRTVSRYDANFRSRQRPRTKDRPTVNATTRPRRPPVIDYDYYEDEVPIIVGKSVLNSKLFLTSKGTVRCLDQGNFPHPYSCKKFITCARMVNGQVIGTEYTCPDKLSFDPIGGICNWSAGLGCKD